MAFSVPQNVIEQTGKCEYGFACIKGAPPCAIVLKVTNNVREIFCAMTKPCPYCEQISRYEGICRCPVRAELYHTYGI